MIKLVRTNSDNPDFINLVDELDAYLKVSDGDEHEFYNQYNNLDVIKHTVVAYLNNQPAGCGALKIFDGHCIEIKRMFTKSNARGHGIATKILQELEDWAKELNYQSCILETGTRQIEAIGLYKKNKYQLIPNYGPYINAVNSLCFKKIIS
jgi:putative acetyltransferase